MRRSAGGFAIVELVVALLIGSTLTSSALASFGDSRGRNTVLVTIITGGPGMETSDANPFPMLGRNVPDTFEFRVIK